MWQRYALGALILGVALGCNDGDELGEGGANAGAAGSSGHGGGAHAGAAAAGASGAGVSGEGGARDGDTPAGAGGELNVGGDTSEGGEGGEGGVASVHFFTDATQHVEIACFGFFDGYATFRADRAQLSADQLELLGAQVGVPGSTYDDNDDGIHCVVTTTDARSRERQFVLGADSALIEFETSTGGAGAGAGAGGDSGQSDASLLGCEFRDPFADDTAHGDHTPIPANPLCVREIWPDGTESRFPLALAMTAKPYHIELIHCTAQSLARTTVTLFGADPETPLAVGTTPADPGPDQTCLVLDAQVDAPAVGHLVFTSPGSLSSPQHLIFR